MKNLLSIWLVIWFIGFTSCEKKELDYIQQQEQVVEDGYEVSIINKWLLIDGQMFFTNLATNEKTVMNHFGPNRTTSSLRYAGILFEIERLEQNITTWEFIYSPNTLGNGEFILNDDTEHPYGFYITRDSWRILEYPTSNAEDMLLEGSARPFSAYVINDSTIIIQIQEVYEGIGGYNQVYFNELKFEKINQ